MGHNYTYRSTYQTALRVNWQIDEIIGGAKQLDFRKPFLPDAWVDASALDFLTTTEQRVVNHIRSHSYLYLFGLVEEFIVPFVIDHVRSRLHKAGPDEIQALLHFAEEESKHIELFKRFGTEFSAGFGSLCEVIGPPETIAAQILSKSPLGVVLVILHIEWMTQLHYVESVRDNSDLDPQFRSLLRHHWLEEAQHAKLDTLMAETLVQHLSEAEIVAGVDDYLAIGGMLDDGLTQQVELDLAALTRATGRQLTARETERYRTHQQHSYRKTFLTSGMEHPRFQETLNEITPAGATKALETAETLVPETMSVSTVCEP
jgi:hypothetical protein